MPAALDQPQFELNQAALYISHFAFLTKKKKMEKAHGTGMAISKHF